MTRAIPALIVSAWVLAAASAQAQSLADVARQEAERRKTIATPGKLYTNESLRDEPPPVVSAPAAPSPAPEAPAAAGETPAAGAEKPAAPDSAATPPAGPGPQTEAEWRKRAAAARDALSRSQTFSDALQSRINALTADFVNRDDPAQREVVAAERQKALAELDRVKQEILEQQKAITAIQEEARKAGVPAGWVR